MYVMGGLVYICMINQILMFKAIFETAMHRFASKVYPGRHDLCVLFII